MGRQLCGAGWQLWVGQEGGWSFGRRRFGWCGAWCLAVFARMFADEIAQSYEANQKGKEDYDDE